MSAVVREPREPWIKVKLGIRRSDKMASLPSDTARLGWFYALIEAKVQRQMGVFANRVHFNEVLGRFGRYLPNYMAAGLLHEAPLSCPKCLPRHPEVRAGELVIHDYRKEQRDPTNADRQAEWYAEHNPPPNAGSNSGPNGVTNAPPNALLTRAGNDGDGDGDGEILPSLRSGGSAGKPRPPSDLHQVAAAIHERGLLPATGYVLTDLRSIVKGYGAQAVIDAFARHPDARTVKALVKAAEHELEPAASRNGTSPKGHTRAAQEAIDAFNR